MAGNRYYPPSAEEVWQSWEWPLRERLESIDYIARQMFQELVFTRMTNDQAREFMGRKFAELVRRVANELDEKAKYRRREGA